MMSCANLCCASIKFGDVPFGFPCYFCQHVHSRNMLKGKLMMENLSVTCTDHSPGHSLLVDAVITVNVVTHNHCQKLMFRRLVSTGNYSWIQFQPSFGFSGSKNLADFTLASYKHQQAILSKTSCNPASFFCRFWTFWLWTGGKPLVILPTTLISWNSPGLKIRHQFSILCGENALHFSTKFFRLRGKDIYVSSSSFYCPDTW